MIKEVGDVLWIAGSTDFVQGIDQCALILRLECDVEVHRGFVAWLANTFPVWGDCTQRMLNTHVTAQMWLEGHREWEDNASGEERDRREPAVVHDHEQVKKWRLSHGSILNVN